MYLPTSETLLRLAETAGVAHLLEGSDADWDSRQWLTPPGLVWSIPSDTCMTGRTDAPANIAYGEYGQEFVFRQPRSDEELAAIFVAARHEVYACYRFDGLDRWARTSAEAWFEMTNVVKAWVEHAIADEPGTDIADGLASYRDYLDGNDFATYRAELIQRLSR